jgi:hypothetical protein
LVAVLGKILRLKEMCFIKKFSKKVWKYVSLAVTSKLNGKMNERTSVVWRTDFL